MTHALFITNDEQRHMLEQLDGIAETLHKFGEETDRTNIFNEQTIDLLRSIDYQRMTLPKRYGGLGYSLYDAMVVHEKLAAIDGSTALIAAWTLLTVGDLYEHEYWDEKWLHAFAQQVNEGTFVNRAVSEAATGSPVRGGKLTASAKLDGDEWLINAHKCYTTGSHALNMILVATYVEDKEEMGYFLVPKHTPGMEIVETWDVLGMRGSISHDLVLTDVRLPKDHLVELFSDRQEIAMNGWMQLLAATYLGIAQAAFDEAVRFANTHSPNSIEGTIAQLPNVRQLIGEMELLLQQARYVMYGVAEKYDTGMDRQLLANEVAIAKYTATNNALQVVDKAMRLVGARSLMTSNVLQRYYRDVRAGLHNPPMDDLTIAKLAQNALK